MPRYYFHVYHERTNIDQVGTELPDKNVAWENATKTAGEILRELDGHLKPGREWKMVIEDEFKQELFAIHIGASTPTG